MAGITQTIPNYNGGISEQPDQLKMPGQVRDAVNVVPDPVWGLYKRPGSKRITPDGTAMAGVSTDDKASWFHYYRDPTEGSYVGQIDNSGVVKMWKASTGAACTVNYGEAWVSTKSYVRGDLVTHGGNTYRALITHSGKTGTPNTDSGHWTAHSESYEQSLKDYLTPAAKEDIQALTIMDTTFISNRNQSVLMFDGDTEKAPQPAHPHFAYVEILKTENGRQYSMNVYNQENLFEYRTATAIEFGGESSAKITANDGTSKINDTLADNDGSGTCRGIGTQVFQVHMPLDTQSFTDEPSQSDIRAGHKMRNLSFRITTTGQNGLKKNYTATSNGPQGTDYKCTYHRELTLLHGGEGWQFEDTTAPLKWKTSQNIYGGYPPAGETVGDFDANNVGLNGQRIVALTDQPKGDIDGNPAQYRIRVTADELVKTKGKINGNAVGVIRPQPTPWDRDTGVTADAIIAGILQEFEKNTFTGYDDTGNTASSPTWGLSTTGNKIYAKMIGTGIYIYSDDTQFNVEIIDNDLMRVMQDEVNDVSKLPIQCKHGYIVKVSNSQKSDEDDYYLKFKGDNNLDGPGSWVECPAPGVLTSFKPYTMPCAIQRTAENTFTVRHWQWGERLVGDDNTNPIPSFAGVVNERDSEGKIKNLKTTGEYAKINKILFFRNRLALLSRESVILAQAGNFTRPSFWRSTALAVSAVDCIDIAAAGSLPSTLFDGIETNSGLLCFSRNQQYLLASDDTVMNPDTAKLRAVATYYYNEKVPPISLGVTTGFVDNSGKYSRFQEMSEVKREGQAVVAETSQIVPTLLPKDIDLVSNSKENNLVFLTKTGTNIVYVYKYLQGAEGLVQSAWVKWKFLNPIQYQFVIDDSYYFIDDENFLQKINLVQSVSDYVSDAVFTQDGIEYLVHLDNYIETGSANYSYDAAANETTYTFPWLNGVDYTHGTDPSMAAVCLDAQVTADAEVDVGDPVRLGKGIIAIAKSRTGQNVVFPGNMTPTNDGLGSGKKLTVGWLYEYKVNFPRIYPIRVLGPNSFRADVNSRLTLHRLNFNFGKVGTYSTTLTRLGKDTYTDQHESGEWDSFNANDLTWVDEDIRTIPVYEKNESVDISLTSTHPSPATLHSLSWEGDFTTKHYRRV